MMKDTNMSERPGFDRAMTPEEITGKPLRRYIGPVHIINSAGQIPRAIEALRGEMVLGFDTETKPAFRKGQKNLPALVQLAGEKAVYIFHLARLNLPNKLRGILSDPRIIKAGVAVNEDIEKLREMGAFVPAGFVDLASIARHAGIVNQGLRGLAAVALGFRISKQARVSNWASKTLTPAQIRYAATDAWVSRELYIQLQGGKGVKGVSLPKRFAR